MLSVRKARQRLQSYPDAYLKCAKEAAVYGKCVIAKGDLKKDDCAKEFQELRACVQKNIKQLGKR